MNESQKLIIETIVSSMLGLPNIQKIFTEEIIKIVTFNPSSTIIILVSFLKIILTIAGIFWIMQLAKNIEFTYKNHNSRTFKVYLLKIGATAIITFFIMLIIRKILFY